MHHRWIRSRTFWSNEDVVRWTWTNKSHSPLRLHELPTYDQAKKNWDTRLGAAAPGELPGELPRHATRTVARSSRLINSSWSTTSKLTATSGISRVLHYSIRFSMKYSSGKNLDLHSTNYYSVKCSTVRWVNWPITFIVTIIQWQRPYFILGYFYRKICWFVVELLLFTILEAFSSSTQWRQICRASRIWRCTSCLYTWWTPIRERQHTGSSIVIVERWKTSWHWQRPAIPVAV